MEITDAVLSMPKGWIVTYENGQTITEYDQNGVQTEWNKIPKVGMKSLTIKWNDKHWTISGKAPYIQKKRAWISPGMSQSVLKYRYIGYWDGSNQVLYQVDEQTGQMKMVVKSPQDNKPLPEENF
jgi:hypothetical protein